ncbi:MAG: DUF2284 domain-containing protein [Planctomycetota bacterium]|nr:DUF2284 domain-containing protein [Planctomycetota bacterium]
MSTSSRGNAGLVRRLACRACELGADKAKVIDAGTIVTASWVRWKCQYGCGGYRKRLCCPPNTPTPEQTAQMLSGYRRGVLMTVTGAKAADISKIAVALEREAFLAGCYKAFAFGAGPCRLCPKCDPAGRCRHPYEARPAMEACGIDVYATVCGNGWKIEVVRSEDDIPNYFALTMIE